MADRDETKRTTERTRRIGRALNDAVVRAPWLWPVMRAPMRRFFGGLAPSWDERTSAGSVSHLGPLAAAAIHVTPVPERVLDIGTGTGAAALFLAREFPRASVRGVDIAEEMIRLAQAKVGLDPSGRVAFRVADAWDLPFSDGSFDLVAQLNMPPFFAEIARVLRPGGSVIVASSWGPATPFYTPDAVLERRFRSRGISPVQAGTGGEGTFWVGRRAE